MNESSKNNRRNYYKKMKPGLRANGPYIDLVIAFKAIVLWANFFSKGQKSVGQFWLLCNG